MRHSRMLHPRMRRARAPMPGLALALATAAALLATPAAGQIAPAGPAADAPPFTRDFLFETCDWRTTGSNPFFILQPGYRMIFEGEEDGEEILLVITVTDRTEVVDGVTTRVVVEREVVDGELYEVSWNYFAICGQTNSVAYFGEFVNFYEDGEVVDHHGSWRAGVGGARPGIAMPGTILLGGRYFQEIAPDAALDRAEILSMNEVVDTPAGRFRNVLETRETTPLEPGVEEFKFYAPGVGLIKDGPVRLAYAFFLRGEDPADAPVPGGGG